MEVLLFFLAVVVVPLRAVATVTLLGRAAGRRYAAVVGPRRRREGKSAADVWADVVEARRDSDALRARPDIDQSWTAWQRRDRQP
jgi:hypothetical protein